MSQDQSERHVPRPTDDDERHREIVGWFRARSGRPPTVEEYRETYRDMGLDVPDDVELRRRHEVSEKAS